MKSAGYSVGCAEASRVRSDDDWANAYERVALRLRIRPTTIGLHSQVT